MRCGDAPPHRPLKPCHWSRRRAMLTAAADLWPGGNRACELGCQPAAPHGVSRRGANLPQPAGRHTRSARAHGKRHLIPHTPRLTPSCAGRHCPLARSGVWGDNHRVSPKACTAGRRMAPHTQGVPPHMPSARNMPDAGVPSRTHTHMHRHAANRGQRAHSPACITVGDGDGRGRVRREGGGRVSGEEGWEGMGRRGARGHSPPPRARALSLLVSLASSPHRHRHL